MLYLNLISEHVTRRKLCAIVSGILQLENGIIVLSSQRQLQVISGIIQVEWCICPHSTAGAIAILQDFLRNLEESTQVGLQLGSYVKLSSRLGIYATRHFPKCSLIRP